MRLDVVFVHSDHLLRHVVDGRVQVRVRDLLAYVRLVLLVVKLTQDLLGSRSLLSRRSSRYGVLTRYLEDGIYERLVELRERFIGLNTVEQVELEELEAVGHDRVGPLGSGLKFLDDDIVASDAFETRLYRLLVGFRIELCFWWFLHRACVEQCK